MAIGLFALAPIGMTVLASWLGDVYGCSVSEAGASPCRVGGRDLGPVLADLFTGGWYMMATVPVGLVLMVVWLAMRRGPRRRDANA